MKKKIFTSIAALLLAGSLLFAIGGYVYSFILSCGVTIYCEFDHQLSDYELIMLHNRYEEVACGGPLSIPDNPII